MAWYFLIWQSGNVSEPIIPFFILFSERKISDKIFKNEFWKMSSIKLHFRSASLSSSDFFEYTNGRKFCSLIEPFIKFQIKLHQIKFKIWFKIFTPKQFKRNEVALDFIIHFLDLVELTKNVIHFNTEIFKVRNQYLQF